MRYAKVHVFPKQRTFGNQFPKWYDNTLTWAEDEFASKLGDITLLANKSSMLKRFLGLVSRCCGSFFYVYLPRRFVPIAQRSSPSSMTASFAH